MLKIVTIVMLSFLLVAVSPCLAAHKEDAPQATCGTKLCNGLSNMLTGWMEIPLKISEVSKEENAFAGITVGTLKGTFYGIGRTSAGVLDTVTFAFPPYDKPIVEPTYHF